MYIGSYTTDVNGNFYINNIPTGNYELVEKNEEKSFFRLLFFFVNLLKIFPLNKPIYQILQKHL